MNTFETGIDGLLILEPKIYGDDRGYFFESYNQREFDSKVESNVTFVQDNHSKSSYGVVRGLHFQKTYPQGKLVRVLRGEVYDVAVDLRAHSRTFGKSFGIILSETNKRQLWVPKGFAHGFMVISEVAELAYKTSDFYRPEDEGALKWNDPSLKIDWPTITVDPKLSAKDADAPSWDEYLKLKENL